MQGKLGLVIQQLTMPSNVCAVSSGRGRNGYSIQAICIQGARRTHLSPTL
jgi:hypothetical protein